MDLAEPGSGFRTARAACPPDGISINPVAVRWVLLIQVVRRGVFPKETVALGANPTPRIVKVAFTPAMIGEVALVMTGIAFCSRTEALADFVVSTVLRTVTVIAVVGGLPGAV